jgi:hypothetical protein
MVFGRRGKRLEIHLPEQHHQRVGTVGGARQLAFLDQLQRRAVVVLNQADRSVRSESTSPLMVSQRRQGACCGLNVCAIVHTWLEEAFSRFCYDLRRCSVA